MAKRRSVKHIESGKVFKTLTAAENEFKLSCGTLSWELKQQGGNSCEVKGMHFEVIEGVTPNPVPDKSSNHVPEEMKIVKESADAVEISKTSEVKPIKPAKKLEGTAITDKDLAVSKLEELGYSVYLDAGVIMFNNCTIPQAYEAVQSINYPASWGVSAVSEDGTLQIPLDQLKK